MRVISGKLGHLTFDQPHGHRTHPMSEKVRGALFNALGDIEGLTVLDAFAGSGALSFEAISRGAKYATAIDIDKKAADIIKKNTADLGVQNNVSVVRANAGGWSDNNPDKLFDIVFSAPPYDALQQNLIKKITKHVERGGLYILDWPGKMKSPSFDNMQKVLEKNYGDAQLVFYRRIS